MTGWTHRYRFSAKLQRDRHGHRVATGTVQVRGPKTDDEVVRVAGMTSNGALWNAEFTSVQLVETRGD